MSEDLEGPGPTTVVYSDSSRFSPRKVAERVPLVGYVIIPEMPPPKRVDFSIPTTPEPEGLDSGGSRPSYRTTSSFATSTVTVGSSAPFDSGFLAGPVPLVPVPFDELGGSRAERGTQLWDLVAYASALG